VLSRRVLIARPRAGAKPVGRRRARSPLGAVLALAISTLSASTVWAQIGLSPAILELEPSAGRPGVSSLSVMSADTTQQSLKIYVGDWDRGPSGENRFYEPGTQPHSCAPHLHVFPEAVTVGPGRDAVVQVVLDSLPDPAAACWSIVFVENQPPAGPGAIRIVQRVGAKVYGLPQTGLRHDARVDAVGVADGLPPVVSIEFENSGSAPLEPRGSLEIRSIQGATIASQEIAPFPILPGARRTLVIPLASTPAPGSYLALAIFEFGGDSRIAGQASFQVR
jgi:hypothetical protein